jgi:hypothetical protein
MSRQGEEESGSGSQAPRAEAEKPAGLQIEIRREIYTERSTVGRLFVNGEFECYTLEDCARAKKIPGATCIPAGSYAATITFSNRFQRQMPELLEVPGFEGIRIHAGNTDAETEGCILVGETRAQDFVGRSRAAFGRLFMKLRKAEASGARMQVTILDSEGRKQGELLRGNQAQGRRLQSPACRLNAGKRNATAR